MSYLLSIVEQEYYQRYKDNHKKYADWLGKELGYTKMEHWYNIKWDLINNNYGGGLLYYYNEAKKKV